MDKLRTVPADSDCTPLYEIQQPTEKSPEQVPLTSLDVSELLIVKKSIPESCNSQNSANSATTSKNTDSSDDDIIILHESTRKGNSYAAQNKEKARSESKNRNHPNKNIGSRILDEVPIKNESSNLLKSKDSSHNDDILSVKVIRQNPVHRAADSKSKRKDVLDNDIRIVDDVTVEKESCSPEAETKGKIMEEDEDIILDAIVLKIKKKHSTPVSKSQEEDIVDNNTRILDEMDFQGDCGNLTQFMSEDKDGPSNDVAVLDKAPCVDQHRNSRCSISKDRHILKNDIKILTVSSITSKEYNRVPEFKAENKCNDDKIMIKMGITENNSSSSQESLILENSKNDIDIQSANENMIQHCNLPFCKGMKSSVKLNTKDGKSFIRQVGHFSVRPKHEVKQSPENSISCHNEIGYSSNGSKYPSEESSSSSFYQNKNVSRKINCSFFGKNEKIQNEVSVTRKEYSWSPKPKAQKQSIPFHEEIILDADITTNNTPSSPESSFTQNSKNYMEKWRNVNKIQFCNFPVFKETNCDVESERTTKDINSFNGKVGHSSEIQSDEVGKSSIKEVSHNNKVPKSNASLTKESNSFHYAKDIVSNNSAFEKKEECKKNENEIPIIGKEYNLSPESKTQHKSIPFEDEIISDTDITENNPPSSQELIFVQNSKNGIDVKGGDENKIQVCNFRVTKEVKSGVKNLKKYGKTCIDNVRHSSVIRKGEIRQSPIKDVSCYNEVGYSSKRSKSLTEDSNVCNSFKDKSVSRKMNCSLFGKKEKSQKNQDGFSVPSLIQKGEVRQSPIKDASCNNEVGYSSNKNKSLTEDSNVCNSFKDKNVSRKMNCSLFGKKEKSQKNQDGFSVPSLIQKGEVRQSPIKDASCNNEVGYSSKKNKSLTEDSNVCNSFKDKNVSRKMNCSLFGKKEKSQKNQDGFSVPSLIQKGEVRQSPITDVSCNNEVAYSSKRNKSLTEESNFCNSFKDKNVSRKVNCSLFEKKEKSQKNQNGFSVPLKEYNPVHGEIILEEDITEKKPPNSQKSIFAQNSKNDIDIQVENQNKIQYCSFPVVKKRKIDVKPTLKDEKNLTSKVEHSSVVQKCEVGQTSIKAVSSNNEVGYSTKGNKSLTEEVNCCDSFKNRSVSSDMNSSLFVKKESKKSQNGFPSTIKKNNLPPKSNAQNIHFASFEDELTMDVDKTENNNHTSKEPSFAHNSKYRIDIQDENQNGVQCCKLSDVTKINTSVKPTTRGRKNFTGKVKHSSMKKNCKVVQSSIKAVSCNNKEWNSFKKNKSLTEESNSSNSNKVKSYSKNVNCSLLEKKVGSKKNQASCSASTNTMSQDSDSDFDSVHKCIWCSFATPDIKVIGKHMEENHNKFEKRKCPFCDSRHTYGDIFNHIKSHFDEPPYFCQQCPYSTKSVSFFVSHLTCHKTKSLKKFHCENCSFSTDIRQEFSDHTEVHNPDSEVIRKQGKLFSCKVCNKIFFDKMSLGQHQKIHTNSKEPAESNRHLFQCKSCDFSAGRETTLKRHQVVHHPEK